MGRLNLKAPLLVCLMILMSIPSMDPTLARPDAGPVPTLSVSLDPAETEVEVTEAQLGTGQFQGTAEIDQPIYMTSNVSVDVVVNTGWPVVVDPDWEEVTGPDTLSFVVTVIVPPATSSLLVGNLFVRVTAKAPLLAPVQATTSAIVTVDQYCELRLEVEDPLHAIRRGESAKVEVNIYNDGNGQDTFELTLMDVPDGVRASLDTSQVTVQQDENVTFVIEVKVGDDASGGMHTILVRARSMESDELIVKDAPLFVNVETLSGDLRSNIQEITIVIVVTVAVFLVLRKRYSKRSEDQAERRP